MAPVEAVAGPSGSGVMEVEPRGPRSVDQPPIGSPVFTPTSFTQSPNRQSVFTFPPTFNEPSSESDNSSDDGSGGDPSGSDDDPDYEPAEDEYVPIFRLSISSHQYCICGCRRDNLSTVKPAFRVEMIIFSQIYIPVGSKVCERHLNQRGEPIVTEDILSIEQYEEISLLLIRRAKLAGTIRIPSSDSEESYLIKQLTTLSPRAFDDLQSYMVGFKDRRQSLGAYLFRLKSGLPIKDVATLFGFNEKTFSKQAKKMRQQLYNSFIPNYLGFSHLSTRQQASQHATLMDIKLLLTEQQRLDRVKITIWAGTYFFIQKTMNIELQKKLYSGQKKAPLFKPMICVLSNGYIYDVVTYNHGSINDAQILRNILSSNSEFASTFQPGDVFALDRGFRDIVPELLAEGFSVFTPGSAGSSGQLSWEQANQSRKVTKIRWVVEAVFGRIKTQFRLMHHILRNTDVNNKNMELKICCAILNKYGERFVSDKEFKVAIAERIISRMQVPQKLSLFVDHLNLTQVRTSFTTFDPDELKLLDPPLTEHEFYMLATGTYLLKYMDAYKTVCRDSNLQQRLQLFNRDCRSQLQQFNIHVDNPKLLRMRIISRHKSQTSYPVFILIDQNALGLDRVAEWCCKCSSGLRTVNPCGHIMTFLGILCSGFESPIPAPQLLNIFEHEIHDESRDE
ncbi:uncharacterized protein LOC141850685 [Brevipalpus obovatus]|uniref:uncharacterized protein LOC141850685 n=1 Tax=Brevipalpus obovatus TaxID=246614 RepID=UPI003D9DFF54